MSESSVRTAQSFDISFILMSVIIFPSSTVPAFTLVVAITPKAAKPCYMSLLPEQLE